MDRLTRRIRQERHRQEIDRMVARALLESGPSSRVVVMDTGADNARLRGIPAIGRGVSGAIRGTDPEREATK